MQDIKGSEHNYQVENGKQKYSERNKMLQVQLGCETVFGC